VHHSIWRAISRNSLETHDHGERKWYFPSAVSEATHDKWTVRQILVHLRTFALSYGGGCITKDPPGLSLRKDREKNERYGMHLYFIKYLSVLNGRPWNCTQAKFTNEARGSRTRTKFQDRPCLLGVTNSKARDKIRALTVSKTPALSDIILKLFHVSVLRSPELALSSLPTELANSQTSAFQLFKKFTGPFRGLVI